MKRNRFAKSRDGIGITFNFFDFWCILFNRPIDRTNINLRKVIDFCNRHNKKPGLQLDLNKLFRT